MYLAVTTVRTRALPWRTERVYPCSRCGAPESVILLVKLFAFGGVDQWGRVSRRAAVPVEMGCCFGCRASFSVRAYIVVLEDSFLTPVMYRYFKCINFIDLLSL